MNYQKITKHVRRKYYQYSPTLVHITGGQVYVILNQVPMSNHSHKVYCGSIQSVLDEARSDKATLNKIYLHSSYADWCCRHSTIAKNARSICIIQGSKEAKK